MEKLSNETLILSSIGCYNAVLNPLLNCSSTDLTPISPGRRNEFHVGFQKAFGGYIVASAGYVWKYTNNAYDLGILGSTPITFPIEWTKSKKPGVAGRRSWPSIHSASKA